MQGANNSAGVICAKLRSSGLWWVPSHVTLVCCKDRQACFSHREMELRRKGGGACGSGDSWCREQNLGIQSSAKYLSSKWPPLDASPPAIFKDGQSTQYLPDDPIHRCALSCSQAPQECAPWAHRRTLGVGESLPSNARAASTRWDQSNPAAVSGSGIRPGSAHLDLSDKDPSENQNSSK